MKTVGIIGGSGLYEMDGFENPEPLKVKTPWGEPSAPVIAGTIGRTKALFLPRHGIGHTILPSEINYRANIYALKSLGVERIISVSAVGSMREEISPGDVVVPSQFIDHTKNRRSTFFESGIAAHVSMADPVCGDLSAVLRKAARQSGATTHEDATYICMEGPQFSSRAESNLYRQWGVDVIGMTNMPEAKLAREAEICYATLAMSTDYDCWHPGHDAVTVEDVIQTLTNNVETAKQIIKKSLEIMGEEQNCDCANALKNSIITRPEMVSEKTKEQLGIIIERFLK
ncbi:MAG: S-methyl-5'-thioadenosine phosphorylase [Candidatus Mycalebacterium zealandia]|nr:MAG: S-methyl-5'-thioadenosine phosphorylase [Candidatus Mycalebacterium zealandia]